ncbi:MAG TPA: hypothetical protein VLH08_00845 [Acidobacteriota bacterium]|nr:hypothetical protein [Acidobacteriota bacterium]
MVQRQTQELNEMLVKALKEEGDEAAADRAEAVQEKMDRFDKKGAIETAIEEYGIDTSLVNGKVKYDKSLGRLEGETLSDGSVRIGEGAFTGSPGLACIYNRS